MDQFFINREHVVDIQIIESKSIYGDKEKLTNEELIAVLKGKGVYTTQRSEDHPEFTKLRNRLGAEGFIEIERSWWNGDYVLKPFYLNGRAFKVNDKFPCAAACNTRFKEHR